MTKKQATGADGADEPIEAISPTLPRPHSALDHIRAAAELLEARADEPSGYLAKRLRWAERQIESLGGNSWLEKPND